MLATSKETTAPTKPQGNLQKFSENGFLDVPLSKITRITHDSYIYTYQLPDSDLPLGLIPGQHIIIHAELPTKEAPQGEIVKRKYTPISAVDEKGTFDLLIKIYRRDTHPNFPDGGVLTQYLESLKVGDKIRISGPIGRLTYFGHGDTILKSQESKHNVNVKRFGLICGGTGIAPMYMLIKAILDNSEDKTEVSLLFGNKTEEDILLRKELGVFATDPRFKLYYTLDVASPEWKGFSGYVTPEMIKKTMPDIGEGTLICTCGPRAMNIMLREQLTELGYPEEQIHKF